MTLIGRKEQDRRERMLSAQARSRLITKYEQHRAADIAIASLGLSHVGHGPEPFDSTKAVSARISEATALLSPDPEAVLQAIKQSLKEKS